MTVSLGLPRSPILSKQQWEVACPAASASSASAIHRLNGASSLRRSASILNNCRATQRSRIRAAQKANLRTVRSNFALKPGRRERNFWMRRQGAKNRRQNTPTLAETQSGKSVAENPRRNALFGVASETRGLQDPMIKSPVDHTVYQ
jgi:hypothetical protein